MEITKKNFKEALSVVEAAIQEASFLSIDGEFTGLCTEMSIHRFDTARERYMKLRETASNFLLIQFGLSTFHYDAEKDRKKCDLFLQHPLMLMFFRYCFFQASSLDFLASQGFDFNKLIRDGIPYLLPEEEEKVKNILVEKHKNEQTSSPANLQQTPGSRSVLFSPINVTELHQEFLQNIIQQTEKFLASNEESLDIEPCNSFLRKLIYQSLENKLSSGIYMETQTTENQERFIRIRKCSDEKKAQLMKDKQDSELEELQEAVGFSKVIKLITESGKLVIGHNMILDLLHILNQFCCHLPESYDDFKNLTNCVFSKLLDTKHLASVQPLRDYIISTSLNDLLEQTRRKPFSVPTVEPAGDICAYTTINEKQHEAGYDAFITGLCFITLANHLGSFQDPPEYPVLPGSQLLKPYINKLFLGKSHDVHFINLSGIDAEPKRDHVFHVTFPKSWKTSDLIQLFSEYGAISISWLDDASALIALKRPEHTADVLKNLVLSSNSVYSVKTYLDFKNRHQPNLVVERKVSPVPHSDFGVPVKRRRSSSGTCEGNLSNRSIEPIPEEDEDNFLNSPSVEPVEKKPKLERPSNSNLPPSKCSKLFDENDNWT
ncbi:poly(A)-specific ribonuclease PARN-like [Limulus polyphemus]|uniref:Poly(A)-specific ribonuclease PARN n=1 Tax=Limulus polyphemus TaxID=6850 RepID=A0ABM1SIL8_LIMPO|nr:poly(A)-specific ribonuclease PARN-like [Limulus polyphemus]